MVLLVIGTAPVAIGYFRIELGAYGYIQYDEFLGGPIFVPTLLSVLASWGTALTFLGLSLLMFIPLWKDKWLSRSGPIS